MSKVVTQIKDYKSYKHYQICPYCGSVIEFFESEIIISPNGRYICCPNCKHNIL